MTDYSAAGGPSGPRADIGIRFVAALIDGVIVGVANIVLFAALGGLGRLAGLIAFIAYFSYFEGSPAGQTIGKRAMKIRVIDFGNGQPLDFGKAAVRAGMRYVSGLVCGIGFLWALWDKEKQTWHDKVAGTVVVPVAAYPVDKWPG